MGTGGAWITVWSLGEKDWYRRRCSGGSTSHKMADLLATYAGADALAMIGGFH